MNLLDTGFSLSVLLLPYPACDIDLFKPVDDRVQVGFANGFEFNKVSIC